MQHRQFNLPLHRELVIDLFAGGGHVGEVRAIARALVAANYTASASLRRAA
jgi:hypothetical protein